jgi:hypothetical protein
VKLRVRVVPNGQGTRPPVGTPVRIEVRDVTLQDAQSTVVVAADTRVADVDDGGGASLATAVIELADDAVSPQRDLILWARVAASGAERVAVGDWITMQSIPVRTASAAAERAVDVEVRPVR